MTGSHATILKMIDETLKDRLEQVPFVPFVVRATSGQAYSVHDPALVVLMKSRVFIAEPGSDRSATIPYLHISAIQELGNGHAARRSRRRRG